jgi:hypothetical protein
MNFGRNNDTFFMHIVILACDKALGDKSIYYILRTKQKKVREEDGPPRFSKQTNLT